jgi:hypothetical protein
MLGLKINAKTIKAIVTAKMTMDATIHAVFYPSPPLFQASKGIKS